jgi:hypothetical protein
MRKAVTVGIRLHHGDRFSTRAGKGGKVLRKGVRVDLGHGARTQKGQAWHSDLFSVIIPQFLSFGKPYRAYFRNILHILKQNHDKEIPP